MLHWDVVVFNMFSYAQAHLMLIPLHQSFVFVCGSVPDAVSISQYITTNGGMIGEY